MDLQASKEELQQHCSKHSEELAEARRMSKLRLDTDRREIDCLRVEMEALTVEVERQRQQDEKVSNNARDSRE